MINFNNIINTLNSKNSRFNITNGKLLLYGFLVFCVASSKHIIIYNEETLVVLCTLAFFLFIKNYHSQAIVDGIDEKGELLVQEYEASLNSKTQHLYKAQEDYLKIMNINEDISLIKNKLTADFSTLLLNRNTHLKILEREHNTRVFSTFKYLLFFKDAYTKLIQDKISQQFYSFANLELANMDLTLNTHFDKELLINALKSNATKSEMKF
uniref:ATP synthase F0 subunit beta n=1 Tax=Helicosporidium sp. subsp. Simulium jonesii TaxID=145475 RepID=D3IZX4_HELSJ|nr:ATP synthase F0 subunit beta [Helicosporidium sp. ex Simulium jonesi]ACT36201.1 ATP synthase F0 subunit beta [Helicosporidium sp. ex Simulium jonesi]